MINNDVLRNVRYMLDLADIKVVDILKLARHDAASPDISKDEVTAFLKKEDDAGFAECGDEVLSRFLDGLIIFKRGARENQPAAASSESRLNNNLILKKLRVAFELKEEDMHAIMEAAEFQVSKPELSALFRKEGQKNYRPCGDQFLRNFLKGLTVRMRP
jgi:uncharacterized protein YehS (DUF1456 family)